MELPETDLRYLERATAVGRGGWGRVHPNPMVGCLLVKDGTVLAEAYHREFGGPHAEVLALEEAGASAEGATAYVSLEPCRHVGKTPACTTALVRAGVDRVVFGASDPGRESGGGAEELREAGVEAVGPVFTERRSWRENPAFHHTVRTETPYVALKLAVSLDARIAARRGERTSLTGAKAGREVHRLRAGFDAVMVGAGTARVDDPLLTVREDVPMRTPPSRIILDTRAGLSPDAALFRDVDEAPVVVFTGYEAPEDALEKLEEAGATVHPVAEAPGGGGVDLDAVLEVCWATGLRSILCEGGAELAASLLRAERVQRIHLVLAPRLLGKEGVEGFPARPGGAARGWAPSGAPEVLGEDVWIVYDRVRDHEEDPGPGAG